MSKLLSDRELDEQISTLVFARFHDIPAKQREVIVKNLSKLFNTQKRLYAEMVVGEYFESPGGYPTESNFIRNELIQEQRARIK